MLVTPEDVDLVTLNSNELEEQGDNLITMQGKLEEYLGLYDAQCKLTAGATGVALTLVLALLLTGRALIQTRRTIRQRQAMNEEQTLFYTNPDTRALRQVLETPKDEEVRPRSQDTIFAETLNEAIRKNMSNPELKIEDLGEQMGMSRVQLYRRVKALTGISPVELLRQMRLQRGYNLLVSTTKSVSEIAFEVGFNTPSYFSNCFKKQYGKYPTDVRGEINDIN